MYQKVLVPLDGSELAECSLPHVMNLVKGGVVGEVLLLTVVERPSIWLQEGIDFSVLVADEVARLEKYLGSLQLRLSLKGVNVTGAVVEGVPAESIIEYAKRNGVDLIALATHGYTGMKKLMFGSVALRVLHDAHVPVFLVRPEACQP